MHSHLQRKNELPAAAPQQPPPREQKKTMVKKTYKCQLPTKQCSAFDLAKAQSRSKQARKNLPYLTPLPTGKASCMVRRSISIGDSFKTLGQITARPRFGATVLQETSKQKKEYETIE
jgi:hypothetical protein